MLSWEHGLYQNEGCEKLFYLNGIYGDILGAEYACARMSQVYSLE